MTVSKIVEEIDNEIVKNKAHYNLDRITAKISDLSSRNVSKYQCVCNRYRCFTKKNHC